MRQAVTREQLLSLLNRELDRHRECRGAKFSAVSMTPREPDATGCNWQREDVYLSTSGSVSSRCWSTARQVLRDISVRYNLTDPDAEPPAQPPETE